MVQRIGAEKKAEEIWMGNMIGNIMLLRQMICCIFMLNLFVL